MPRTLVITPTYDERENLPVLVERLHAAVPGADLLIVDDASPDGTGALADELHARHGERVRVLHRDGKRGLGSAYVEGFRRALEDGYDVVVQMDADLSHDPRSVPALLARLDEGADLVIGSRWVPGGGIEGWGLGRLTTLTRYPEPIHGTRCGAVRAGGLTRISDRGPRAQGPGRGLRPRPSRRRRPGPCRTPRRSSR